MGARLGEQMEQVAISVQNRRDGLVAGPLISNSLLDPAIHLAAIAAAPPRPSAAESDLALEMCRPLSLSLPP